MSFYHVYSLAENWSQLIGVSLSLGPVWQCVNSIDSYCLACVIPALTLYSAVVSDSYI